MSPALDGEIGSPIGFLADRFRGAPVGTGVGDALGAPVEGVHFISPSFLSALDRNPGPLRYTDDTDMTIGVASSLRSYPRTLARRRRSRQSHLVADQFHQLHNQL